MDGDNASQRDWDPARVRERDQMHRLRTALDDAESKLIAAEEDLAEAMALLREGSAFKVHDLATRDCWVIDDVSGVHTLLARYEAKP